jgi:hypothetical protein
MRREMMKMLFDPTIYQVSSPSKHWSLRGHIKKPVPTMLYCMTLPAPLVAPQDFSRFRSQCSAWCSPSCFPASSLPTPTAFQAATLRSRITQPFETSNEMYPALFQESRSDIVRQTNNNSHNSNRASMTCKLRPTQPPQPHCAVTPRQTTQLYTSSSTSQFRPRPSPLLTKQLSTSSSHLSSSPRLSPLFASLSTSQARGSSSTLAYSSSSSRSSSHLFWASTTISLRRPTPAVWSTSILQMAPATSAMAQVSTPPTSPAATSRRPMPDLARSRRPLKAMLGRYQIRDQVAAMVASPAQTIPAGSGKNCARPSSKGASSLRKQLLGCE